MDKFKINLAYSCIAVLIILYVVSHGFVRSTFLEAAVDENAKKILDLCEDSTYRPLCYDIEIPKLMDRFGMEEVFEITRAVQDKDSAYPYCHVLGHSVGGIEVAKDPSKWKEVATRCPVDMCSNGCMHGAFQERFRTEALPGASIDEARSILEGVCESREDRRLTGIQQGSCMHALGHLTMYVTNADTEKSIRICDKAAITRNGGNFSALCYDGVFMQLFQPLEPEDFSLIEGKVPAKYEVLEFCSYFSGEEFNSCWSESWPLSRDFLRESPSNVVSFCSTLPDTGSRRRCLNDIFYILSTQFNLDEEKIADFCSKETKAVSEQCFYAAASRLIEIDSRNVEKAIHMCQVAGKFGVGEECYRDLASNASHSLSTESEYFFDLCSGLPQPWRNLCFSSK